MQFHQVLRRQAFHAVEKLSGADIDAAHLALFLGSERHNPQREHLVDFGAVEEIAQAFRATCG